MTNNINTFEISMKASSVLDTARLATWGNLGRCADYNENDTFIFECLSYSIKSLCDAYRQTRESHLLSLALQCKKAEILLSLSLGLGSNGYRSLDKVTILDDKEKRLRLLCEYAKGDEDFIFQCHSMYKDNNLKVR